MISQTVLDYIKSQLDQGVDSNKIKADLMSNGCSESDLQRAFSAFNITFPVSTPVTPITPVSNPITPVSTPVTPITPVTSPFLPPINNKPSKSKKYLLLISVIVIILLIGGGVFAYFSGIRLFSRAPYSEKDLMSGLLENFSKIKSGTYKTSGSLLVTNREDSVKPFEIKVFNDEKTKLKFTRDYARAQNIRNILNQLESSKSNLPSNIKNIFSSNSYYKIDINDPLTKKPYDYKLKDNGQDFDLTVNFETKEAIFAINKEKTYLSNNKNPSPVIKGQTVTFSRNCDHGLYLSPEPPVTFFESLNQSLQFIPADINVVFSSSFTSDWGGADLPTEWKANLDATGDLGDLTYKANADALKKGDVYFLRINNIPNLGFLNIPKNQWLKIEPNELTKKGNSSVAYSPISQESLSRFEETYQKERNKMFELIKRFAKIADEEGVLVFKDDVKREKKDGQQLYRYDLKITQDKIIAFYKRLIKESQGSNDLIDKTLASDIYLDKLESQEFKDVMEYFENNSSITLWVNNDGYPIIMEYSLKVAPPDNNVRLKGKQAVFTLKLEMSDINKAVKIEEPKDSKSIIEVIDEMTGSSLSIAREKGKVAKVASSVASIRASAELVYNKDLGYGKKAFSLGPCSKTIGTLFGDDSIYKILMFATDNNISKATCGSKLVNNYVKSYVVSVPLPDNSGHSYCVDSTGSSKEITGKLNGYSCSDIKS